MTEAPWRDHAIAVVGMAGRFPGDRDVEQMWNMLLAGDEAVRRFTADELHAAGVPDDLMARPEYVPFGTDIEGIENFDAEFFGINPGEARLIDPQHRVFLECVWSALEDAGTTPAAHGGRIGVFGSTAMSSYLLHHIMRSEELRGQEFSYPVLIGNDKDFLCTRVSFRLNLTGPSVTVQTACSSSLVAVGLACQSLHAHQCEVAVAGGVSIFLPQTAGYLYKEGGTFSRDGHCRPFDATASGMARGCGCGVVVLKRLADAVADRDRVYAVIKSIAVNNDGADKVGYTAPSVVRQDQVIRACLATAEVPASAIGYVETHGTGTYLGDPIEIAALLKAYTATGEPPDSCALGSMKANVGHLDTAAGVAGLIKAALVMKNQVIPPQINFTTPNPELHLDDTPFVIPTRPCTPPKPIQAVAVTSLGIGGTNAHCILTPPPEHDHAVKILLPPRRWNRERHWVDPDPPRPHPTSPSLGAPVLDTSVLDTPHSVGDDIAEIVLDILRTYLRTPDIGPDDDYFARGGDSLIAVEIVDAMRRRFGVDITLARFAELGTPRRMAAHIAMAAVHGSDDRVLTKIRDGLAGREIFYVHPAGGTTYFYYQLVRHSHDPSPVFGLSYPMSQIDRLRSIPEMARYYINQIRQVKPRGPYRLGGYSMGGNVALEMALQLAHSGEAVEHLIMFDALPPENSLKTMSEEQIIRILPRLLQLFLDLPEGSIPTSPVGTTIDEVLATARQPHWSDSTIDELRRFVEVWKVNEWALSAHRPRKLYTGDLFMFTSSGTDPELLNQLMFPSYDMNDWNRHVTGQVQIIPVSGNHFTMVRGDNLVKLARTYDRTLAPLVSPPAPPATGTVPPQAPPAD